MRAEGEGWEGVGWRAVTRRAVPFPGTGKPAVGRRLLIDGRAPERRPCGRVSDGAPGPCRIALARVPAAPTLWHRARDNLRQGPYLLVSALSVFLPLNKL